MTWYHLIHLKSCIPSFFFRSLPPLEFELLRDSSGPPRLRFKPAPLSYQAYASVPPGQTPAPNARLQDIVSRLGEICLSPELAHVMLFPVHANAFQSGVTTEQNFPDTRRDACLDPPTVLDAMDDPAPSTASLALAAQFLTKFQLLPAPTLTTHRQPFHLCAWRLDLPSRVCLYTGDHPADPSALDLSALAPHTLSKVLLEERSRRACPSGVRLIPSDDISPNAVRTSLLHYAQADLAPHTARGHDLAPHTVRGHYADTARLDTTLEEALACLIHAPARNHTQIELHQSPPWDKDHIDAR